MVDVNSRWRNALIGAEATLREAMEHINSGVSQLALVVDSQQRLLGTVSDGDIRRALLAGKTLADLVADCMCRTPATVTASDTPEAVAQKMRQLSITRMPVVDAQGRITGLRRLDDLFVAKSRENPVVIMAGGLGSRLKELTAQTPKPMLAVGDRPLLETIIRGYVDRGFANIWLAVNYRAEQIESHFGDGAAFGASIQYLREDKRLGTAGALSLLAPQTLPVVVSNADLLTTADIGHLLDAHLESGAVATMAVREHTYQVPYGVVHARDGRIAVIDEKPTQHFMVNAGLYVLSPDALARVPLGTYFDMTELFSGLLNDGQPVGCHLVRDYWLDIGQHEDLQRAHRDFPMVFE